MGILVALYSNKNKEINRFLKSFYNRKVTTNNKKWEIFYSNPVQSADIIGTFIDNSDKYNINMWISFDNDFYINVRDTNVDKIIRYLYERYPY